MEAHSNQDCHLDHAGHHLIGTSLPLFSLVIGAILRFCRGWTRFFRLGGRGHILLRIESLEIELGDLIYRMQ
jgi:hypothetical protein